MQKSQKIYRLLKKTGFGSLKLKGAKKDGLLCLFVLL